MLWFHACYFHSLPSCQVPPQNKRQSHVCAKIGWSRALIFVPRWVLSWTTKRTIYAQGRFSLLLRGATYDVRSLFRSLLECLRLLRLDIRRALFTIFLFRFCSTWPVRSLWTDSSLSPLHKNTSSDTIDSLLAPKSSVFRTLVTTYSSSSALSSADIVASAQKFDLDKEHGWVRWTNIEDTEAMNLHLSKLVVHGTGKEQRAIFGRQRKWDRLSYSAKLENRCTIALGNTVNSNLLSTMDSSTVKPQTW
jgi:hypothetical protein